MTREELFEFEGFESVLIQGEDLSLKVFFSLKRHIKVFEDMGDQV